MRPLIFAVGLFLTANAASSDPQGFVAPDGRTHVKLTNGCVYTQNLLRADDAWSLIYTEAGTSAQCPLTVFGLAAVSTEELGPAPGSNAAPSYVAQAQPAPVVFPQRARLRINPQYVVGVFR